MSSQEILFFRHESHDFGDDIEEKTAVLAWRDEWSAVIVTNHFSLLSVSPSDFC